MTETSPVASVSYLTSELAATDVDTQYAYRARAGRPLPLVDVRVRDESGIRPWDDSGMAELEVRGPWVAGGYYDSPESADRFTEDGWFKTGDVASIDARGYITIRDRAKDVVKSGGEWISSVALENAIMGMPGVAEAAVVGIAHPRWDERPLALVVLREGCTWRIWLRSSRSGGCPTASNSCPRFPRRVSGSSRSERSGSVTGITMHRPPHLPWRRCPRSERLAPPSQPDA